MHSTVNLSTPEFMKICVLQPDYRTTEVDYKNYDPPRDLSALLSGHEVHHIFLNKLTTYKQLKQLSRASFDIYINLCEGYLEWEVPSIDVIHTLDALNLPYTGPNATLYDPPKSLMKYVAYCAGVKTPDYILHTGNEQLAEQTTRLQFHLFVKPAKSGDSLGIDDLSRVDDFESLQKQTHALLTQGYDEILIEEYIDGREFTVLVAANPSSDHTCKVYQPIEYRFPAGKKFKTYALKTSELHTDVNVPVEDEQLKTQLSEAAAGIFKTFAGVGYARLDFRMNDQGHLYFLEINFTCSVFYTEGYEGSADYILNHDPAGKQGFLQQIITEGITRHTAQQKKYKVSGNAIYGYGITAVQNIQAGEIIFHLEESAQRVVTKRYVMEHWTDDQKTAFRHYAYPISDEVYILWDHDPRNWAPQNHSCDPNTTYDGLNLRATKHIAAGEELTLDYSVLLDEMMGSFQCHCNSVNCRKIVSGVIGNSITTREKSL